MVRLLSRTLVASIGLLISEISLYGLPTLAQIIPDQTLGTEASVIVPNANINGKLVDLIEGGATRNTNLFHSFEQFNINESQQVYFNNPNGVETILTRITGNHASDIRGTLGVVNGNADLFLLNPNGIIFGENAQLDVGGSFVATTADALQFGTLGTFSSRDPDRPSLLLTIAPSAFLFASDSAGPIVNQSTIAATYDDSAMEVKGLRVPNGETLGLLGGDVRVEGGWINASGGRIEIGSVAGAGRVGLHESGRFQFSDAVMRGHVRLQDNAVIDTASSGGGTIRVFANTLDIFSSVLQTGIQMGQDSHGQQAGNIVLNGTERIRMIGVSTLSESDERLNSGVSNTVERNGMGDAGNIRIISPVLRIEDGAQVNTSVLGEGNAGRVVVEASDRLIIDGIFNETPLSGIFSVVEDGGKGRAGQIRITTPILKIGNGSRVSASITGEGLGAGNGGNITINASDRVILEGLSTAQSNASGVFSTIDPRGSGRAGQIQITTPILTIRNGARITSTTEGQGDGGSVTIHTQHINLEGRADNNNENSFSRISSEAFSLGASSNTTASNAGRIEINASVLNVRDGAQIASSSQGAGEGGDIIINATDQVNLDGSRIQASSLQDASGQAGNITLTTEQATVENESDLLATTEDTTGGNISLTLDNLFLLSGSRIVAAAGAAGAGGDGGNIVIDADFIVTLADQDSDIDANAFNGDGGNITIEAENLFNIEFQDQAATPRNDITVSSVFGLDGEVTIESPNVDPSRGTSQLPSHLVKIPLLNAICHPQRNTQSQFVMTGRGGHPTDPTDMLGGVYMSIPWVTRDRPTLLPTLAAPTNSSSALSSIEAQDWVTDDDGRVVLVTASHRPSLTGWPTVNHLCTS